MWVNISPCVWMWKSPTGLQAGNLSGDLFLRFFLLTGGTFLDHHAVLIDTIVAILPVDQPSKIGVDFLGKTNTSGCGSGQVQRPTWLKMNHVSSTSFIGGLYESQIYWFRHPSNPICRVEGSSCGSYCGTHPFVGIHLELAHWSSGINACVCLKIIMCIGLRMYIYIYTHIYIYLYICMKGSASMGGYLMCMFTMNKMIIHIGITHIYNWL